jgi:hypothetical protein
VPTVVIVGAERGVALESQITQIYETTVVELEAGHSLTLTTLPAADGSQPTPASLAESLHVLELELLADVPISAGASFLPHAFVAVLAPGDPVRTFDELSGFESPSAAAGQVDIDPTLLSFAEYCANAEVLPLEQSRLAKVVVVSLVTAAGGTAAIAAGPAGPIVIAYFAGSILAGGAAITVVDVAQRWVDKALNRKGL